MIQRFFEGFTHEALACHAGEIPICAHRLSGEGTLEAVLGNRAPFVLDRLVNQFGFTEGKLGKALASCCAERKRFSAAQPDRGHARRDGRRSKTSSKRIAKGLLVLLLMRHVVRQVAVNRNVGARSGTREGGQCNGQDALCCVARGAGHPVAADLAQCCRSRSLATGSSCGAHGGERRIIKRRDTKLGQCLAAVERSAASGRYSTAHTRGAEGERHVDGNLWQGFKGLLPDAEVVTKHGCKFGALVESRTVLQRKLGCGLRTHQSPEPDEDVGHGGARFAAHTRHAVVEGAVVLLVRHPRLQELAVALALRFRLCKGAGGIVIHVGQQLQHFRRAVVQ